MLKELSFEGEITIKFGCGCWVTFEVTQNNTMIKVERKDYGPCSEHGGGLLLGVDGEELLETLRKELKLPSLFDLLFFHNKVTISTSLVEFV